MPVPILLLTKEDEKNKPSLYFFFQISYPYKKSINCIIFGSLVEFQLKS